MRYGASNGWLDGQPAVITRKVGKGSITYVGAWLDDALMSKLTASWIQMSQIQPILPNVPEGVEVCRRSGSGKSVVIVINHSPSSQSIALPICYEGPVVEGRNSGFPTDLTCARSRSAGIALEPWAPHEDGPHISLVFREMRDTANLDLVCQ